MDAVSAFTQGEIDDPIYVEIPPGYANLITDIRLSLPLVPGALACRLSKALYGLKQSAMLWLKKIQATLKELGFTPLNSDECVYRNSESRIIIITYVDDFLIFGADIRAIQQLKIRLQSVLRIEDLGHV